MTILIVGWSSRAMAESAAKSNLDFFSVDYFGDLDHKSLCDNFSLLREAKVDFSPENLYAVSKQFSFEAVTYTSNLENSPNVIKKFQAHHEIIGNDYKTLIAIRNWAQLNRFLELNNILHPQSLFSNYVDIKHGDRKWLRKPFKSGGGIDIQFSLDQIKTSKEFYLQEYISGIPCSAAFVSNGKESILLGLSEQLIGDKRFGAHHFLYCGNITPISLLAENDKKYETVSREIQRITNQLTHNYRLKGVNGVDFILRGDKVYLLEINPRYTASMELLEALNNINIFTIHVNASRGQLPQKEEIEPLYNEYRGKAILYATRTIKVGNTYKWNKKEIKDIPFPDEIIEKNNPICTLISQGKNRDKCYEDLLTKSTEIKKHISPA